MYNNIVGYFIKCYVRVRPLLLLVDATMEVKLVKLRPFIYHFVIYSVTNNSSSRSLMQKNIRTLNFNIRFTPNVYLLCLYSSTLVCMLSFEFLCHKRMELTTGLRLSHQKAENILSCQINFTMSSPVAQTLQGRDVNLVHSKPRGIMIV